MKEKENNTEEGEETGERRYQRGSTRGMHSEGRQKRVSGIVEEEKSTKQGKVSSVASKDKEV